MQPLPCSPWLSFRRMAPTASTLVRPGPAVAGAQTDMDAFGQMKAAIALRVKYRKGIAKRRICVIQMGVHMMNRGPLRCTLMEAMSKAWGSGLQNKTLTERRRITTESWWKRFQQMFLTKSFY